MLYLRYNCDKIVTLIISPMKDGGDMTIEEKIKKLKKEKDAVIVAHTYQTMDVQKIADMTGDSFQLSKYCAGVEAKTIVFCGVMFMAESAKILSPEKTVLLPDKHAGCPMANMVNAMELRKLKEEHPDAGVMCYVNSTAEVKAESDICCTSSNAVQIAKSLDFEKIIFVPDKNLGHYVATQVPEKEFILWDGFCPVHDRLTEEAVEKMQKEHPEALLAAHPECTEKVLSHADYIGSTKGILEYVRNSDEKEFIIATEQGVVDRLTEELPDKKIYLAHSSMVCKNMKKTTLEKVLHALETGKHAVEMDPEIMEKARKSLERMVEAV